MRISVQSYAVRVVDRTLGLCARRKNAAQEQQTQNRAETRIGAVEGVAVHYSLVVPKFFSKERQSSHQTGRWVRGEINSPLCDGPEATRRTVDYSDQQS